MGDQLFCPLLPFPPLLRGALQNPSVSITLFAVQALLLLLLLSFYHHHCGRRQTRIEGRGRQSLSLGRRKHSLFPLPTRSSPPPPPPSQLESSLPSSYQDPPTKEAQGSLSTSAAMSVLHKGWGCSSACFLQRGGGGGGGSF